MLPQRARLVWWPPPHRRRGRSCALCPRCLTSWWLVYLSCSHPRWFVENMPMPSTGLSSPCAWSWRPLPAMLCTQQRFVPSAAGEGLQAPCSPAHVRSPASPLPRLHPVPGSFQGSIWTVLVSCGDVSSSEQDRAPIGSPVNIVEHGELRARTAWWFLSGPGSGHLLCSGGQAGRGGDVSLCCCLGAD